MALVPCKHCGKQIAPNCTKCVHCGGTFEFVPTGTVAEITDDSFQADVLDRTEPVLVDFWAPWCGPCKMIAPAIEELADEYAGKVYVGKVNTDQNTQIATNHKISAIPTVMLFMGGEVVERFVGVNGKEVFATALDKYLPYSG